MTNAFVLLLFLLFAAFLFLTYLIFKIKSLRKNNRLLKKETDKVIKTNKRTLDSLMEGVQIIDSAYRYIYVNESVVKHSKYTKEELLGNTMMEKYPGIENTEVFSLITNCLNEKKSFYIENEFIYPDKSRGWFELSIQPVPEGVFILSVDITKRKVADMRLQESLERVSDYKFALNESCIVAITDQKGIIQTVNENFCKISKYSKDELIGNDHRMINSGYHNKAFMRNLWATIANGKVWRGEIKNKAKDGTLYWVDTTIIPFLDKNNKPYQYAAIRADITDKKKTEEVLVNTKRNYLELFHSANNGIIVYDNQAMRALEVNQQMLNISGYDSEEILNNGLLVFGEMTDAEKNELVTYFDNALQRGNQFFEWESKNKNDESIWYEVNLKNTIILQRPRTLAFFNVISDRIKIRKELIQLNESLEEKVEERTQQLSTVNKELESFSYSISHDLRAPLRALNGYSKMIEEDYAHLLDEEANRLLGNIQYYSKKMGQLIDDLLSFSRMGRKEIARCDINMQQLVSALLPEINESNPNNAKIILHNILPSYADPQLIQQVWINLISNAIKYSGKTENPVIEISSEIKNNEVCYQVKDNGAGFDMKYAHRLFGVFQRLHTPEDFEGTGIGLAIVQRILIKHDGKIWCNAEPDKGATFYFTLPIMNEKQ